MDKTKKETSISESFLLYKEDRIYYIDGYIGEVDEYKDNRAYIDKDTGRIYICSKNKKPYHNDVPILKIRNDEITKIDSTLPEVNEYFVIKNCNSYSFGEILEKSRSQVELYDETALADMNAATSVFVPVINPTDDALKKIIKQTIISKNIDINRLKHRMPQKYGITNLKSALVGTTKMSITSFNIWCELLGVNYTITISDSGSDIINPLEKSLIYTSTKDVIEEIDIDDEDTF